jgi:hypothetical protein
MVSSFFVEVPRIDFTFDVIFSTCVAAYKPVTRYKVAAQISAKPALKCNVLPVLHGER